MAGDSLYLVGRSCEPEGLLEQERGEGGGGVGAVVATPTSPPLPPSAVPPPALWPDRFPTGRGQVGFGLLSPPPSLLGASAGGGPVFFLLVSPHIRPALSPAQLFCPSLHGDWGGGGGGGRHLPASHRCGGGARLRRGEALPARQVRFPLTSPSPGPPPHLDPSTHIPRRARRARPPPGHAVTAAAGWDTARKGAGGSPPPGGGGS